MAGRWLTILFPVVCTFQLHRRYALHAEKAQVDLTTTTRSGVASVIESIAEAAAVPVINPATGITVPAAETVQEIVSPVIGRAVESAQHVILPPGPPLELLDFETLDPSLLPNAPVDVDSKHAERIAFLWDLFTVWCTLLPVINHIWKAYFRASKGRRPVDEALAPMEEGSSGAQDACLPLHEVEAETPIVAPQPVGSPVIVELDDPEPTFAAPRPASRHPRATVLDYPESPRPASPVRVFILEPDHAAAPNPPPAPVPIAGFPIRTMMLLVTQFLIAVKAFMAENGLDHRELEAFCCCYLTGDRSLLDLPALYRDLSIDTPWTRFGSMVEDFRKDHDISHQILRDLLNTYLDRHVLFFGVVGFINEENDSEPTLSPPSPGDDVPAPAPTGCSFLMTNEASSMPDLVSEVSASVSSGLEENEDLPLLSDNSDSESDSCSSISEEDYEAEFSRSSAPSPASDRFEFGGLEDALNSLGSFSEEDAASTEDEDTFGELPGDSVSTTEDLILEEVTATPAEDPSVSIHPPGDQVKNSEGNTSDLDNTALLSPVAISAAVEVVNVDDDIEKLEDSLVGEAVSAVEINTAPEEITSASETCDPIPRVEDQITLVEANSFDFDNTALLSPVAEFATVEVVNDDIGEPQICQPVPFIENTTPEDVAVFECASEACDPVPHIEDSITPVEENSSDFDNTALLSPVAESATVEVVNGDIGESQIREPVLSVEDTTPEEVTTQSEHCTGSCDPIPCAEDQVEANTSDSDNTALLSPVAELAAVEVVSDDNEEPRDTLAWQSNSLPVLPPSGNVSLKTILEECEELGMDQEQASSATSSPTPSFMEDVPSPKATAPDNSLRASIWATPSKSSNREPIESADKVDVDELSAPEDVDTDESLEESPVGGSDQGSQTKKGNSRSRGSNWWKNKPKRGAHHSPRQQPQEEHPNHGNAGSGKRRSKPQRAARQQADGEASTSTARDR